MQSAKLVIVDAWAPRHCEHFESLRRWLAACVPRVGASIGSSANAAADRENDDGPALLLAHAATEPWLERLAGRAARRGGRCIGVVHRDHVPGRECVPASALEALCEALSEELGRLRAFQVLPGMVGCSQLLCHAAAQVHLMADSDAVCLLQGETGTGKELFARAIHYSSARRDRPFVPVNCGAIPETLFENELFGHARGAYTDAKTEHPGLLAHAESGTLFLDEIDCLSASAQVKLLRVLQEHEYRPVGSAKAVRADLRVIAATNSDLRQRVEQRKFREDLFHRLNILRLSIPPLRERRGDVPLLARWFVEKFAQRYRRALPLMSDEAYAAMEDYAWPGNVRELQALLERAVLLTRSGVIAADDLELPHAPAPLSESPSMKAAKDRAIREFERSYLAELMRRCAGNVSQAARVAGKERRSFQRLLRKHRLSGTDFRSVG